MTTTNKSELAKSVLATRAAEAVLDAYNKQPGQDPRSAWKAGMALLGTYSRTMNHQPILSTTMRAIGVDDIPEEVSENLTMYAILCYMASTHRQIGPQYVFLSGRFLDRIPCELMWDEIPHPSLDNS